MPQSYLTTSLAALHVIWPAAAGPPHHSKRRPGQVYLAAISQAPSQCQDSARPQVQPTTLRIAQTAAAQPHSTSGLAPVGGAHPPSNTVTRPQQPAHRYTPPQLTNSNLGRLAATQPPAELPAIQRFDMPTAVNTRPRCKTQHVAASRTVQ